MAAGTLTPATPTVPWVTWSEDVGGHHAVFVSRLVGGDHFELFNGGNPVSGPRQDAATPDITFFGNTPYVSWTATNGERHARVRRALRDRRVRHRHAGRHPADHGRGPARLIDARVPLSSNCTADPFTTDGAACTPGDVNAPFFTFTTAGSPQRLFSQAAIGGPNCVLFKHCVVAVNVSVTRRRSCPSCASATRSGSSSSGWSGITACTAGASPAVPRRSRPARRAASRQGAAALGLKVNGKRLSPADTRSPCARSASTASVLGTTKPVDDPRAPLRRVARRGARPRGSAPRR